jgi:hypothetical protein
MLSLYFVVCPLRKHINKREIYYYYFNPGLNKLVFCDNNSIHGLPKFSPLKIALELIADLRRAVTAAHSYGRLGKYLGIALTESDCQSCCVRTLVVIM